MHTDPINSFRPVPAFNAVIHFSSLSVVNQSPLNKTAKVHRSEIWERKVLLRGLESV